MWDKIQDILIQDREDSNALSVMKSLQGATPSKAKGAAAEAQPGKGKASSAAKASPESKAILPPPTPKSEAPAAPAPTPKPKPKPKAKAKAMTDAEKAKTPCVFFRMPAGCIHGENCKYSHEVEKAKAPPSKPKPKAKEISKAKASPLAKAVVALVAASSLCTPAASAQNTFSVEWAADTAAGRHLGSASALSNQGIPKDAYSSFLAKSSEPVTFHTGGGPQPGVHTLGFQADNMSFANHYILDNCPLVRSTGLDVTSGKAIVWLPNCLPFFVKDPSQLQVICPEENRFYATRVEEHVPIFTSQVKFANGAVSEVDAFPMHKAAIESEDEEPHGSVPSPEPLHPAEDSALSLLRSGRAPNAKDVKRLFNLVDKSPSPRPCVDDKNEDEELSSFSTGCFRRGGVIGLRKNTTRFPLTTKVLVQFAKAKLPNQVFATLTLFSNTSTQPHRDFHNAPIENSVISLGGFRQGGIWIQDGAGNTPCPTDPALKNGRILSFKNGVIKFSAKDVVHSTQPWVGDRKVLVAYTVFDPAKIDQSTMTALEEVGFPVSSESLACASSRVDAEGAALSPDGPAAPAPPEGDESKVPERVKKLRDEAMSVEHRIFHFPKNPFCDICNQAKLLSKRVRRKPRDPESEPDPLEASEFGEVVAVDHIHVFRSPDDSNVREYVVLCVRDRFTGLFAAYPAKDRSTDTIVSSLRRFMGRRVCSKPVSLVSDAADEFESAAKILGWIPTPSLPNRFPHNSQHEREIRSFQEGVRSSFLEAGFAIRPELWPIACKYGSMALNLSHASPADSSLSRWDFGVAHFGVDDNPVKKLILGQLVFYRSKSDDKFSPNAKPGLFAGWRIEPGFTYRPVTYVLDLAKVKHKSGAWDDPFSVPEAELYVREGDPVFPLKNAAEQSLLNLGSADPSVEVPEPLPLPFSSWSGLTKKARRIYITYSRFLEIGPTPGCSACENDRSNHNAECVERFEKAFGKTGEGDRLRQRHLPTLWPSCPLSTLMFRMLCREKMRTILLREQQLTSWRGLNHQGISPRMSIMNLVLLEITTILLMTSSRKKKLKLQLLPLNKFPDTNYPVLWSCMSSAVIRIPCLARSVRSLESKWFGFAKNRLILNVQS